MAKEWRQPPSLHPSPKESSIYRRLFGLARPYRIHFCAVVLLSLLASPIALLTPLPLKITFDSILDSRPLPGFVDAVVPGSGHLSDAGLITFVTILVLSVALLNQLQAFGSWFLQSYIGERVVLRFQSELFAHVQRLSLAFHDSRGTADSLYRIQYDAREIQNVLLGGAIPLLSGFVTVVGMIVVTAGIDWQLALVALGVAPLLFFMLRAYKRRTTKRWHEAKQLQSSALSVVQETLGALRVVKAFGQEERHRDRFFQHSDASVRAKLRLVLAEAGFGLMVGMTMAIGTASLLFIGVRHVQSGLITSGDLLLIMGYLTLLYEPLQTISQKVAGLQSSLTSAERAFHLLDEVPDVQERPHAKPLERARGAISFVDVSFSYLEDRSVLRNVTFDIEPGRSVGVLGTTGAGKTTLVNLLSRFFDPTAGAIFLDGIDLRAYKLADLRSQFAIVLQEPVLFSANIADNIAYARPEASLDDVILAARAANAHDFITSLPEGYETQVGERGMKLSGGERQRISLARAFLKDAPILILDEPTSSVDTGTESLIMDAMTRLKEGRTTLMIAHRTSTLEMCDDWLYVDQGSVMWGTRPGEKVLDLDLNGGSSEPDAVTRIVDEQHARRN